jgi:hypothetical protein
MALIPATALRENVSCFLLTNPKENSQRENNRKNWQVFLLKKKKPKKPYYKIFRVINKIFIIKSIYGFLR